MEFYGKLFVGDGVADRADKIKQKLLKNEFMPFVHVITLPLMACWRYIPPIS